MSGHSGHGVLGSRRSGGRGRISSWWTDRAPWRWAVPRQSAPVSPPPMMMTRLPSALIGEASQVALLDPVGRRQVLHRLVDPGQLPAGDGQVPGDGGPAGQDDGIEAGEQILAGDRHPGLAADVTNDVPSSTICWRRRSRTRFSILNSGMP